MLSMTEWQPIETWTDDIQPVDIWTRTGQRYINCRWIVTPEFEGWHTERGECLPPNRVTHWMNPPAPPQ